MGVLTVGFGVLLLGIPMCLAGVCTSTLRRKRWLSGLFRRQGWLYAVLSGRWLSILSWTAIGACDVVPPAVADARIHAGRMGSLGRNDSSVHGPFLRPSNGGS